MNPKIINMSNIKVKYMARRLLLMIAILAFFGLGCKNNKAELAVIEKEVIAVHDSVMVITTSLYKYKKELRNILSVNQDTVAVFDLLSKLEAADEAMMEWMEEYSGIDKYKSFEENREAMKEERERIEEVKEATNLAVREVETYINNFYTSQE